MIRLRTLLQKTFPALITGGAGDDPAGVLTYTTVGAVAGFSQLWLLFLTTPLLVAAVGMVERVTRHTGLGLVAALRKRFGRRLAVPLTLLLLASNLATFAADTSAVAEVLQLLTGLPWEVFIPPLLALIYLLFRVGYPRMRTALTVLALVLLVYGFAAALSGPDWGQVLQGVLIPKVVLDPRWGLSALGLLGTTISPYMLFWHGNQTLEEMQQAPAALPSDLSSLWLGMGFSNLVSLFIVVAAAQALHGQARQIASVLDAARGLEPLGPVGGLVFVLGILGAGLLALPVFAATSAYAIAELFGWNRGLSLQAAEARGFYWVLGAAAVGGALISLLPNFNPADALFYSQVFNGLLLPVLMVVLLLLSNDARVVGQHRNPIWVNASAVLTAVLAIGAIIASSIR